MKALSISQPWSWLIVQGIKDIENRKWTTDYRGLVLIHAGKQPDHNLFQGDDLYFPFAWKRIGLELTPPMPQKRNEYEYGGIVGYATLQKVVTQSESPWYQRGYYGFVLTQRHPVDFIPLRGKLGLFDVPKEIEDEINEWRDRRFWEAEMKEQAQIKREWYEYAHEGDETPDTRPWEERIP